MHYSTCDINLGDKVTKNIAQNPLQRLKLLRPTVKENIQLQERDGRTAQDGHSDIFIHRWAQAILGFKILNINIFFFFLGGGVRKNEHILEYKDILGGRHKIGVYLGFISMHFGVFSKGQGREWGEYFWGLLKFKYFWGA